MSEEMSGCSIRDSPSASSENASALMVCDFEPGISIPPDSCDGFTLNVFFPVMVISSLRSPCWCFYTFFTVHPPIRVNI